MAKTIFTIGVIAALATYVNAECNNMCSGHGVCGANDACICYRNWRGNDCSERTCQFGVAFIDTAQGDLDHDGTIDARTSYVKTQWAPKATGGTFEEYPLFGSAQEAHAYMECSNKGLCDRVSGECVCFDGYEGSACQRTVCPNSCSGHGVCRNIVDVAEALSTGSTRYGLWDGLKNQACVCDPGYSGVDCNERLCPKGADPLRDEVIVVDGNGAFVSATAVADEVQTVDISSTHSAISGTFKLRYTDVFGEVWTTAAISAVTYVDATTGASAVADALKGIPNSVIEDVTVTAAASANGGAVTGTKWSITFIQNAGDLNKLEIVETDSITSHASANTATASFNVLTPTSGTKIAAECSGRGLCDYETGVCKCFRGYRLDDCSSQHALAFGSTTSGF